MSKQLESPQHLLRLLESLGHPMGLWAFDGSLLLMNQRAAGLLGGKPADFAGKHLSEIFPENHREYMARLEQARSTGQPHTYQDQVELPGGPRWFESTYLPFFQSTNGFDAIQIISQDITDTKLTSDKLDEAEEQYHLLVENVGEGIAVAQDGRFTWVNRRMSEIWGYSPEGLVSRPFAEFVHPDDRALVAERHQKRLRGEAPPGRYSFRVLRAGGDTAWVELSAVRIQWHGQPAVLCFLMDITERMARETEFGHILDAAIDGFWLLDHEGRIVEANPAAARMLGYSREDLKGLKVSDIDLNESEEDTRAHIEMVRKNGSGIFETRHRRKNGQTLDVEVSTSYVPIGQGRLVSFLRDITERKRAEREREITLRLLHQLSRPSDMHELMAEVSGLMRDWSGCEAVGIRLQDGEDYPYYETRGFPAKFVKAESRLCEVDSAGRLVRNVQGNPVLECMCGNVIRGRFDPSLPFFTANGSFWTNSTSDLLASTTKEDRQARTRNRCHGEGYQSVALIPLRHGDRVLGLLQFNDSRRDSFTLRDVAQFERLAASLALGLSQRAAVEALQESERRFALAMDSVSDAVWDWRVDSGEVYFSPRWYTMLGYEPYEMPQSFETWRNLLHPEDLPRAEGEVMAHLETARPFEVEFRMRARDGRWIWVLGRGKVMEADDQGRAVRMLGTHVDITERKAAEEALRASEAKMRSIFLASPIGIGLVADRVFMEVNDRFCQMLGYAREELVGRPSSEVYPTKEDFEYVGREKYRQIAEFGTGTVETRMQCKDGTIIDVVLSSTPLDPTDLKAGVTFTCMDITERKRSEVKIRESEERYRLLFERAIDAIFVADPETGALLDMNRAAERLMGYSRQELVGKHQSILHPTEEKETYQRKFRQATLAAGREFHEMEVVNRQGQRVPVEISSGGAFNLGGQPVHVGIFRDISVRKQAEQALRDSEAALRKAQQVAKLGGWRFDPVSRQSEWSEEMFRIFGREPSGQAPRFEEFSEMMPPEDWERLTAALDEALDTGAGYDLELSIKQPDGAISHIRTICEVETDENGRVTALTGTAQDITAAKRAEAARQELEGRIQQAEKMDALGTLSSGIAHDFNNILAAIMGYSDLAEDDLPEGHPARQDIAEISKAAAKAKHLVRQILTFSRKAEADQRPMSVNRAVRDASAILERTIPKMINLNLDLADDLQTVKADPQQIEQILLNLASNAADAIDGAGTITVTTGNARMERKRCDICGEEFSGTYVMLSVKDTGSGIDPEILPRIFDPFFTTKAVGRGTGLGLSTVYGVLTSHGGHMACETQPGEGTEFRVYLPIIKAGSPTARTASPAADQTLRGDETILMVDDEATMRDIGSKMLERKGYTVLRAASAEEALEIYAQNLDSIDAVVMDLGMPGMGGKAALPEFIKMNPQAKVLIASGYIQYEVTDELKSLGASGMVSKPYSKITLLQGVRNMLDGKE